MTKISDEERVARGHEAERLLGSHVFKEALEGMRERAIERWRESASPADREEEWRFVRVIDEVERLLLVAVRQGAAAAKRAEESTRRKERLRRAIRGVV